MVTKCYTFVNNKSKGILWKTDLSGLKRFARKRG